MKILRRYFFKEFFRYFIIIVAGFTAVSTTVEFFDKAGEFFAENPPLYLIIEYLLLQTPQVILYSLPFASLFSVLITIGIASRWRETIIIRASGAGVKRLFSGFLVIGIIITGTALFLGETVVPAATRKAAWIRKVEILRESPRIIHSRRALWLKGIDGSLIRIDGFIENENRILKTSIFSFDRSFGLERRIEADEGIWSDKRWELRNVTVFDFRKNTTEKYKSLIYTSLEEPKIFREEMKKPEEMNFLELRAYYTRLEKAGFRNLKYIVRLYEKLAYPTISFIMILLGIPLALNTRWGGGIRAAGLGVIIAVCYWLVYSVSISLGNAGSLPPWLAPWIAPFVFCVAGALLYFRIEE